MLAFFIAQDEWGVFRKSWTVALLVFLAISNLGIYQYQSIQSQQGRLLTKAEYEQPTPFYIGAGHEYLPDEINYQELLKQKKRQLDYSAEQVTITNVRMPYGKISFDYQVVNQSAKVTVPFIYYLGYQATIQMKNQTGAKKNEPNQSRRLSRSFFIWYRTCRHPLPKNKSAKNRDNDDLAFCRRFWI